MIEREVAEAAPGLLPFVELSRARLAGDPPLRGAATFESVHARALQHSLARRRRSRALFGVALAAMLALVAFTLFPRGAELTYRVAGVVDGQGRVLGGPKGARIEFSDGSHVVLEPGAQTRVHSLGADGARVRLEEGRARVVIAKRPRADWAIEAGPYVVKVTGTSFDVRWSASEQSLDVAMESGSVAVRGPLLMGDLRLEKGQQLSAVLPKRSVTVEDTQAMRKKPFPEASVPAAAADVPKDRASTKGVTGKDESPRHAWSEYVARGDFGAVIAEAEQRGLERTLESAAADDLAALADAARYGRRADIATRALLSQRRRFPGTPIAQRAAFFLGQLSEGRPDALEWYERYLSESPRGPYVPQALGRKLMLVHEQSGAANARPLCEEYLRRYPNGPYAAAARKILDSRPAAAGGVRTSSGP